MRRQFRFHVAGVVCASGLVHGPAVLCAQSRLPVADRIDLSVLSQPRVIKFFDFDESKDGNYSDVPMFWERHTAPGFPHYVTGTFDRDVGHDAPPSFRLDLNSGSVAYHYRAPIIRVKPNSDYQITAWVRTTRLKHARAWISAYFLDVTGAVLPGSERAGPLFGGKNEHTAWQPVTLFLTGGRTRATHLGLSVWLVQRTRWHTGPELPRRIDYQEVRGSAWFDDIEIAPLPHRTLAADVPGNIFRADEPVRLRVNVDDSSIRELAADLEVRAANGDLVFSQSIPIRGKHDPPLPLVELPELSAGLYRARMRIRAKKGVLSDTYLSFAKLAPTRVTALGRPTQYGLILGDLDAAQYEAYERLVENLGVGRVKFPIDLELLTAESPAVSDPPRDAFLRRMIAARQRLIATFTATSRGASEGGTNILDILDADPDSWRPGLSVVLAHFADMAYFWQLAPDGQNGILRDDRMSAALGQLRKELAGLLTDPSMVAPWSANVEPPQASAEPAGSAEFLSVHVPNSIPVNAVEAHLRTFTDQHRGDVWAVIEPPPQNRYLRVPRLADQAKRLIFARWAGVHALFTPPLWHMRDRLGDRVLEPDEDYLVFRTVADALGRGRPAGRIYLGPTVECRIFDRGGQATLAIWDDEAPPGGRIVRLYLSPQPTQLDLWGNASAVPEQDRKHVIHVSRTPVFIIGLDTWLQRFRAGFALDPPHLESSVARHEPQIVFSNPSSQPLAGSLVLHGSEGWDIRPNRFRFALGPGKTFRRNVILQFARNESAGPKALIGAFELDADRTYRIRVTAPFELGLRDIDVYTTYKIASGVLTVRQTVTNRSDRRVSFRSFVHAPNRARRERYIYDLPPGRSVLKEYVFRRAASLMGRRVRVALREIHGKRMRNDWIEIR